VHACIANLQERIAERPDVIEELRRQILVHAANSEIIGIEGLLTENRIFKQRNVGIAEVKLGDAWGWGFSGVMVRGSGAAWDLRRAPTGSPNGEP
jgi:NADH:ubiquinone oxidoreductase subunit D